MRRLIYTTLVIAVLLGLVLVAPAGAAPARADRGAWAPGVAYAVNDTVTYGGCTYQVRQAHTSLAGWEPPNVPALFTLLGCGVVPTATRTNTPTGPTATRTNTPTGPTATRTPTPPAGTGVIFYQDANYGGTASGAKAVGDYATMPGDVPNDWMSSLRVPSGWTVAAYADGSFGGAVCTYTADTSWVGAACNDVMSSFKIYVGSPTATPTGGAGFSSIVSNAQFNQMFPSRNAFYTYQGLVTAAGFYPAFAGTGSLDTQKREAAAAMANFAHETSGLFYITEIAQNVYCDATNTQYPCAPGQKYYGRGPIQLSWNFNYGAAGAALGLPLLANPSLAEQDASVAWKTALWYWMTQKGPGTMTAHDAMVNGAGFGETIRSINGSLECNGGNPAQVQDRVNYYNSFISILGTTAGPGSLSC